MKRAILVGLALAAAAPAQADTLVNFVHLTCVPEANYFELTTPSLYNVVGHGDESVREAERTALARQSFLTVDQLEAEGFVCRLPQGTVIVELTERRPTHGGRCGAAQFARARVTLDDEQFFDFTIGAALDQMGGECGANTYSRIQLSLSVTQKCVALVGFDEGLSPPDAVGLPPDEGDELTFDCTDQMRQANGQ